MAHSCACKKKAHRRGVCARGKKGRAVAPLSWNQGHSLRECHGVNTPCCYHCRGLGGTLFCGGRGWLWPQQPGLLRRGKVLRRGVHGDQGRNRDQLLHELQHQQSSRQLVRLQLSRKPGAGAPPPLPFTHAHPAHTHADARNGGTSTCSLFDCFAGRARRCPPPPSPSPQRCPALRR